MAKRTIKKKTGVFDLIAPIYDLFYHYQKRSFIKYLAKIPTDWGIAACKKVIDLGCGTGALCSVLDQTGHQVTGVDSSEKMLYMAQRKPENNNIRFLLANADEPLPFAEKSFDLAVTSFVAHGLQPAERKALYSEMKRLSKKLVIIYDYNKKRSLIVNLAEWAERGDYFNFIRVAETELKEVFSEVHIIAAGAYSTWYICKP